MSKQVIIIFGPPGSGKGTQSELLSEKTGFYFLESSKVLEREFKKYFSSDKFFEIDGQKFFIQDEIKNWKSGVLNNPPFVTFLMKKEIQKIFDQGENLILSGSPRTIYEVEKMMPFLSNLFGKENIKIIFLKISPKETIFRNSHRRICELMRHSIFYSKENEKLKRCPIDNSLLVKRESLDAPEIIKVRLREYSERTAPIVDYFNKNDYKMSEINGEKSIEEVFKEVCKKVNKCLKSIK